VNPERVLEWDDAFVFAMFTRARDHYYREAFPVMLLNYRFEAFVRGLAGGSANMPGFLDYLSPWQRPSDYEPPIRNGPYSPRLVKSVELAHALGKFSNNALLALDAVLLRQSGAFGGVRGTQDAPVRVVRSRR
jgi:hypothetical protein